MNDGFVYILTNHNRTTFYVGVTGNLPRRIAEHKKGIGADFTERYKCKCLVYLEHFDNIIDAITREKQLKNWHRDWKLNLIKSVNPNLRDLSDLANG
jgi:putative endonuclease